MPQSVLQGGGWEQSDWLRQEPVYSLGASGVACGTSPAAVYLSHVRIWIAALNSDEIALERLTYNPPVRFGSLVLWAPLDDAAGMNFAGEGTPEQAPTVSGARLTADPNIEDPNIVKP